jgi:hypothetical protein
MTRLPAALLLLFLVATPPAAAQEVPGSCRQDPSPERVPAPAAVIDTAGLRDALAAVMPDGEHRDHRFQVRWDSAGQPQPARYWNEGWQDAMEAFIAAVVRGDEALLSLDPQNRPDSVHFRSEGLVPAHAGILGRLIDARILPQPPMTVRAGQGRRSQERPVSWSGTLHVDADGTLTLTPSLACPPAVIHVEALQQQIAARQAAIHEIARESTAVPPRALRPSTLLVRIRVGMDGRPLTVEAVRRTRSPNLDRAILDVVHRHAQFRPASVDGMPVPVWVELPIHLES